MEFSSQDKPVIIAIKSLPFSGNEHLHCSIAEWARSVVFRVDDFLEKLYEERGYNGTSRPATEEDERLQRLAFSTLCQVAKYQLRIPKIKLDCVIIDSGLSSTSQLYGLIQLAAATKVKLLIIECRMRHKYIWQSWARQYINEYKSVWFIPKSWSEVEKAMEDYDAKAWDEHYHRQCSTHLHPHLHLKRLVLDPTLDLGWKELVKERQRMSPFGKAIEYLLGDKGAPPAVDFRKWRKQLVERLLLTSSTTESNHLCSNNNVGDCIFTYKEAHLLRNINIMNCRACGQQLNISSEEEEGVYVCASCNLTLHKSCAQFPTHHRLYSDLEVEPRNAYDFPAESTRACNSCSSTGGGRFSYGCRSCIFETHLKYRKVPTVVNNPHLHPHPLSIRLTTHTQQYQGLYRCELCSLRGRLSSYYCARCNSSYHLRCIRPPVQVEHEHGGYRHLMKLTVPNNHHDDDNKFDLQPAMFSREEYVDQDDFWCDVCFREIDPDAAYYSCQDCPDCVVHIFCISPLWNAVTVTLI